ncbi:MAG TPA: Gfo/Idh/MocA family oxidoreductase [Sedimentisphaerales bacterium]|nr:Gfo/Idh/MocA family oxidoreductase [Sedimentisphaerales bacterium]
MKESSIITRRSFIKSTFAAAGAFTIVPRCVLGGNGYIAPSDKINHAIVGVGGMGTGHIGYVLNDKQSELLAVCDVDSDRLKAAVEKAGGNCKGYKDFREVIAREDIDVVHIPTPPHWHGLISVAAAEAGKDVWCEKPMTRTIGEGKKVIEAVQKNGRMFRVNTWFRLKDELYGFGTPSKPIRKLVMSGMLGWPLKVTINAATGFDWKFYWSGKTDLVPQEIPANLDYDFWLGPAPYKPYNVHRTHGTFRGYWDYDGGGLGDMGQHYLDPAQYILGKDNESPVEIEADTPQQHPDAVSSWRRIEMKYADGCKIILDGENKDVNAAYIEGPNGKLYPGFKSDIKNLTEKLAAFPEPEPMITDFMESVRTRKKFGLNEMNAHRSCNLINLGKISLQLGRKLRFDSDKQLFIDDPQANKFIDEPMRGPWQM